MSNDRFDTAETGSFDALPVHAILQQWRRLPPTLRGLGVSLREVKHADASALLTLMSSEDASRFVLTPPSTVEAFEQFVDWSHEQRAAGIGVCLAVVPDGCSSPAGIFQIRQLEPDFAVAEWGFAFGSAFWGQGLFFATAPVVVDFVFDVLGARRLEARATVRNGRGNGALRKLGAVQEALIRHSLDRDGVPVDQVLWAILADEWRLRRPSRSVRVH
jgi:RimJ/RimL family protein N-acetyltransferase